MAQWTFIDPNTLLPGDPWTSAKAQAAFENPIAIIKGAPGAPRPSTLESWFQAGNAFTGLSAGSLDLPSSVFIGAFSTLASEINTSYRSAGALQITSRATGTIRFSASITAAGQATGQARLLRNGTEIFESASQGSGTVSVDAAAANGNVFEWQVRSTSGAAGLGSYTQRANDTVQRFGVYSKISEIV